MTNSRAHFKKRGFIHLKGVIPKDMITYLLAKVDEELKVNKDEFGAQLNRLKYDLLSNDPEVLNLLSSKNFRQTLKEHVEQELFFVHGIGFEIKKELDTGFPWHIGKGSFHYQQLEDFACTLWIPLVPINTKLQHGGMAYVPKDILSGEFSYQLFQGSLSYLSSSEDFEKAKKAYYDLNSLGYLKGFLECYKVEDDFELGDALLFDKYVLHRSNMLYEGPIDKRSAFVMRFIDAKSRYDQKRADNYNALNEVAGIKSNSKMSDKLGLEEGELILSSSYLKPNYEAKIIK